MKKTLSYILILILLLTGQSFILADGFRVGDQDIYYGIKGYKNIQRNIGYKDIDKSFAKDSIIKLTVFDIFRGEGSKFKPKSKVNTKQSLRYISRTLGLNEEEYLDTLNKLGILTAEEYETITTTFKGNQYATREEIAIWIARSLGLQEKTPYFTRSFKDYSRFNMETVKLVEALLQEGYMVGYKEGYFRPKQAITKEELATVLDQSLDDILTMRGFQIKEGEIDNIKTVSTTEKGTPIVQNIYYMKNKDRTYPIIYTSKSNKAHLNKGFLIYDKGKLSTSDKLKKKDTMKYYIDNENNLIYGELKEIY